MAMLVTVPALVLTGCLTAPSDALEPANESTTPSAPQVSSAGAGEPTCVQLAGLVLTEYNKQAIVAFQHPISPDDVQAFRETYGDFRLLASWGDLGAFSGHLTKAQLCQFAARPDIMMVKPGLPSESVRGPDVPGVYSSRWADTNRNRIDDALDAMLEDGEARADNLTIIRFLHAINESDIESLKSAYGAFRVDSFWPSLNGFAADFSDAQIQALANRRDVLDLSPNLVAHAGSTKA